MRESKRGAKVSSRTQVEEALRESEEKYRLLFESIAQGFCTIEVLFDEHQKPVDGRFVLVNPAFERQTGLVNATGRRIRELVPQLEEYWFEIYGRIALTGEPERFENIAQPLHRHYEVHAWRVGEPAQRRVAVLFNDITELKRTEQALRQSEARLRAVIEEAPLAMVLTGASGEILFRNPRFDQLWGRPAHVTTAHTYSEVYEGYHLDGRPIASEEWPGARAVLKGEVIENEVYEIVQAGGRRLTCWFGAAPIRDASGQILGGVVVFRDITRERQTEAALRESEARFRALAETSPVGVSVSSVEGKLLYTNRAYEAILGYEPGELLGQAASTVWYEPADRQAWLAALQVSGRTAAAEVKFRRKDGTPLWAGISLGPIQYGGHQAIIAVLQDVTERKQAQAVLARDKAELERLVAERTARLQELVGELEHFSYTITHDLKAPLRTMRGFAEIASLRWEEGAPMEAREVLGRISGAAERMENLITDALNYSRAVRQELPLTDVDTGALLRGMLDSYPELQPSKAQIRVAGDLPVVLGNAAGLTQVFSNLLGNAVKFVRPGEKPQIQVWAEVLRDAATAGWVRIWVEDQGIGISKAMLPRVFDMFSRGSKAYEGTGIGLALVRKVAQRMGGRAGVESEEGTGSRFWIELKLGAAPAQMPPSEGAPAESRGGTVLYVEDEENDVMFMRMAFSAQGMEATLRVVGDGRAAIQYLSGAEPYADREESPLPSVVLLDLNLPQVPGFEVLKWMRNHPDFARTPVVVFSSSTREDDRTKAKELGADEFVVKPSSGLKFREVVEALRRKWLGRRSIQANLR